ncbi:MAG: DUF4843 domain-containing protein [Bacteroidales bacterium]|nr:DUF4843 domain-containing protein [Bacteroidales bacterium]
MKKYIYLLLVALSFLAVSCEESKLETWHGKNFLHFVPGPDGSVKTRYNFATEGTTDQISDSVPLPIEIWGFMAENDFSLSVTINGKPVTATFRAGHPVDTLWVPVTRNAELLSTSYAVEVEITGAGSDYEVSPASCCKAEILVEDTLEGLQPAWWATTQALGPYSPLKFRLFNIYSRGFVKSIDNYTAIVFKDFALEFREWLRGLWDAGQKYYDTDGTTPLYESIPL